MDSTFRHRGHELASRNAPSISVDAAVRIEAHERDGQERLLRYCARPAFALESLREIDIEHLVFESVKPSPRGSVSLMLTPMPLLDRIAVLISQPRKHLWREIHN